jgi:ubiquinone/menaquinone biosynthesis C-methylase UbiE
VALYARFILPRLIDLAMKQRMLRERRAALVPRAKGQVLEVGIGSGLNLPYYSIAVERLYGLDPSPQLLAIARKGVQKASLRAELVCQSAERLPFADASFDSAVMTWTLCSIPDAGSALREIRRVLKPGGELLFIEHGLAPEPRVAAWQRRLTPLWRPLAGGCHLDRPIDTLIRSAGFTIAELHKSYLKGPKPFTYMYEGSARA